MKSAIFIATGFEEIEAVGIIDVIRRSGMHLDVVSVSGKEVVEGAHGLALKADYTFYQVDYKDYDLLILPGGMPGTENLGNHEDLCQLLKTFATTGKWLAAICAAPSLLGYLDLLHGKTAVCYPGYEPYLSGAVIGETSVVVSDRIITGRGPGTVFDFGLAIVAQFVNQETADRLKLSMLIG